MEGILINHILDSLGEGNHGKAIFNILVFLVIWLEVRGLKKQVGEINKTIEKGFDAGETRFQNIEKRLVYLEEKQQH